MNPLLDRKKMKKKKEKTNITHFCEICVCIIPGLAAHDKSKQAQLRCFLTMLALFAIFTFALQIHSCG